MVTCIHKIPMYLSMSHHVNAQNYIVLEPHNVPTAHYRGDARKPICSYKFSTNKIRVN